MEISTRSLKGQYGSNRIVCDTIFFRKLLNSKKYMSFRLKFLLDCGKGNIWDPWKGNRGQTVLPFGQNFLELLKKKINSKPYVFFHKSWSIFSKTTVWINLYCPWFKFQKMLEMEIKQLLMEIYKESLRRPYGSNRILKRTIWVRVYYLSKIDENFVKGQNGLNCIVF